VLRSVLNKGRIVGSNYGVFTLPQV